MRRYSRHDHTRRLRAIALPAVLRAVGATPDRYDKAKWHTAQGAISVTGCKFFNWHRAIGGGGAIDLVIHLCGFDFKTALAWLDGRFPYHTPSSSSSPPPEPELKRPVPCSQTLSAVKRYLIDTRAISPHIVTGLIQSGDLYSDAHANAVFLMRAEHSAPVGAELRGTGPYPWRGMAPGSRKHFGFFSIREPHINGIILCESAIDALSCFIIHPAHWCLSTAGATPDPSWLPSLFALALPVYCGFDADPTGDAIARAMSRRHPLVQRLRPPLHDWNHTLTTRT